MKYVELLAPAGSKESLIGAINAGANAIFMAGALYGARAFAQNFNEEEILWAIDYAHMRDVKVYMVVNTLIFNDEIKDLLDYTDFLVSVHVDALIVQDLGLIDVFVKRYPNMAIHASTQTNAHSVDQVKVLKEMGVKRVILARETSIDVIKMIKKEIDIELEVFVHGALCVSYSGQCLMSSILNDRSGNRGACAYSCRLPYRLLKEDEIISKEAYLLSAKDLMALEGLDNLIELGIDSFKIEGRMRKFTYVTQTVLTYRKKIDAYYHQENFDYEGQIDLLKRTFNREYTKGFILNESPKRLIHDFRPNHLGIKIGKVLEYHKGLVKVRINEPLKNGDGIRVIGKSDYGQVITYMTDLSGHIIKTSGDLKEIYIEVKAPVYPGSSLHKTSDSILETSLEMYQKEVMQISPLYGVIEAFSNRPLKITVNDHHGLKLELESDDDLEVALNRPLLEADYLKAFMKLGDTPYYFKSLDVLTDDMSFMPVSKLNALRRRMIEAMFNLKVKRKKAVIVKDLTFTHHPVNAYEGIIVKVRTKAQLDAAYALGIAHIYYESILKVNKTHYPNSHLYPLTNRICKTCVRLDEVALVTSHMGDLISHPNQILESSDEFLNVTNIYTARYLYEKGLKAVTLSSELSKQNVLDFSKNYEAAFGQKPNLEYIVYGHKDLMISKYCVIAKTFDYEPNCGLCFKNQYYLKTENHEKMALLNDGACNIRIIDDKPISLIESLNTLKQAGIKRLRIDLTIEDYEMSKTIIQAFLSADKGYLKKLAGDFRIGHFK